MDISTLETLVAYNNQLLEGIYITLLFIVGVVPAVGVCYLLYKFLRKFF